SGNSRERPELADTPIPLEAKLAVVPCRGGEVFLRRLFAPLGYTVTVVRHTLDDTFPDWGLSAYHTVTLSGVAQLHELLSHLYVLVPVLDDDKHYWVGVAEVGKLLRLLLKEASFNEVCGVDVSSRALEVARERLDRMPERVRERAKLLHGSLTYRDRRLEGFDAAAVVEVIEHLDPPRLTAFERVLFEFARPRTIVLTTPNREYNVTWETLPAGKFRHPDHRFEWTRQEFHRWAQAVGDR